MWASPAEPVAFGEDLVVEVLHHLTLALQFLKLVERNLEQNEPLIKPMIVQPQVRVTHIRQTRRPCCQFKWYQRPCYNEVLVRYYYYC